MKRFLITAAMALGVSLLPVAAFAGPVLNLGWSSTLGGLITTLDTGAAVSYNSVVSGKVDGWNLTVVNGTSGSTPTNLLDLGVSATCGSCSSDLYLWLSGSPFGSAPQINEDLHASTVIGTVTQTYYWGDTSSVYNTANGPFGLLSLTNAPNVSSVSTVDPNGPSGSGSFSFTLVQHYTADSGSGAYTSVDGGLAAPEPASLALLGTGLLGLGLFGFKRKAFSFGPQA